MTADKKTDVAPKGTAWTPKTTVEVVLEQIGKQEKRVADLQHELDAQKASLNKLLQAKKILEAS